MTGDRRRCDVTIEGPIAHGTRNAPTWRKQCKNAPLTGYDHCHHHLTYEERQRRSAEQKGASA